MVNVTIMVLGCEKLRSPLDASESRVLCPLVIILAVSGGDVSESLAADPGWSGRCGAAVIITGVVLNKSTS